MPAPPVDPIPAPVDESRRGAALDAQDASYLAASARMASLRCNSMAATVLYIHTVFNQCSPTYKPALHRQTPERRGFSILWLCIFRVTFRSVIMSEAHPHPDQDLTGAPAVEMLREILDSAHICMLVTQHDRFPFHVRPMGAQGVDDDGTVWFRAPQTAKRTGTSKPIPGLTLLVQDNSAYRTRRSRGGRAFTGIAP